MDLPRNILVPTDFSANAEVALDYAVALAAKLGAKVHLLNAVAITMFGPESGIAVTASVVESMLEGSQQELDRLASARAGKAAFGPTLLRTGDARAAIDAAVVEVGADLIVMGTHGRSGLTRLLIGSVAESVARSSTCPVLLVRK
jgi:universal stress protein A